MNTDGTGSRTDPISNTVVLSGLDSSAYLTWFFSRKVSVNEALPQFMHEFTHHWCFNSRVGRALALLHLRSQIAIVLEKGPVAPIEVDLAKCEAAEVMLGPLQEGLALFSEFDLTPRETPIFSQTSAATVMCFGFPVGAREDGPLMALQALLQNIRTEPEFLVDRKAPTYFRPFDIEDAYLPGYLAVKNLYVFATRRAEKLYDPEVFLCYLREVFYNDLKLAQRLLAADTNAAKAAEDVARCIYERFAWLQETEDLESDVEGFVSYVQDRPSGRFWVPGSGWHETTAEPFDDRLYKELARAAELLDHTVEAEKVVSGMLVAAVKSREFIVVAEATANFDVGSRLRIRMNEMDVATLDVSESVTLQASGILQALMPSSGRVMALAAVDANGAHIVHVVGEASPRDIEAAHIFAVTQRLRVDVCHLLKATFLKRVAEEWLEVLRCHMRKNCILNALNLYSSLATLVVSDEQCERVKQTLIQVGFREFLSNDVHLAKILALVGIGHTMDADVSMLCHFVGPRAGIPAERMKAGLRQLRESRDYPLIFGDERRVYATV